MLQYTYQVFQMIVKSITHAAFQNFANNWESGYRAKIFCSLFRIFFVDRCNICGFPLTRNLTYV